MVVAQNGDTVDVWPKWMPLVNRFGCQMILFILFGFGITGVLTIMSSIWNDMPLQDRLLSVLLYSEQPVMATVVVVFTVIGSVIFGVYLVAGSLSKLIDGQVSETQR